MICFMVYLGICAVSPRKERVFYYPLVEYFLNVNYVKFVNNIVQIFSLLIFCVLSNNEKVLKYLNLIVSVFTFCHFWVQVQINIVSWCLTFIIKIVFIPTNILFLRSQKLGLYLQGKHLSVLLFWYFVFKATIDVSL